MADKSEEVAHFQEEHSEQGIADATEQVNVDHPNDCHSPPPAYSAAEVKIKVNDNEGGENDVNGGDGGDSGQQALVTKPPITSTSAFYIKKWILLTMISLTILLLLLTIFLAELILPAIDVESCQTNEDCSMETDKDNVSTLGAVNSQSSIFLSLPSLSFTERLSTGSPHLPLPPPQAACLLPVGRGQAPPLPLHHLHRPQRPRQLWPGLRLRRHADDVDVPERARRRRPHRRRLLLHQGPAKKHARQLHDSCPPPFGRRQCQGR